mgnify:CR=1 FL=1
MVYRIYVEKKPGFDVEAQGLKNELVSLLGIQSLSGLRLLNRYDVEGIDEALFNQCATTVFSEPPVDNTYAELPEFEGISFAVEYLPGQFDQRADSAAECIQLISQGERPLVRSARVYLLEGSLTEEQVAEIKKYVINPVEAREASLETKATLKMEYPVPTAVATLEGFNELDEEGLKKFIDEKGLAMDLGDIKFCQEYFRSEHRDPTITEIKMIDTYWSDHCRHTTFGTILDDVQIDDAVVQAAFDRYMAMRADLGRENKPRCMMDLATIGAKELKKQGILKNLDESEEINACTVKIKCDVNGKDEDWLFLFKNETHNHPTEIEPFGGAATCIGGAIRDPLSGRAYVHQAMRVTGGGDPRKTLAETLPGKLPQRKLAQTAAAGYSSYGNQIGLATGHVAELYHEGYIAKRLECGAVVAAAPAKNVVRERPAPGDVVILLGGRTGRDGIGGATGSSKSHDMKSLTTMASEVQKGNAPEERKIQRLFRNGEVTRLIKRCNDFGAGGVSVAIGELADGLEIELDAVRKKYEGLDGTELAISESQERMAVVVAPEDEAKFIAAAQAENLEAYRVAVVTESPRMVMHWRGQTVADLSRAFLDTNGAVKHASIRVEVGKKQAESACAPCTLRDMAGSLKSASRRGLTERFDSTVGSFSLLMPFGGKTQRSPSQAMAALLPVLPGSKTEQGSVMAWGCDPDALSADPYTGAHSAVYTSVAKIVAAGADYHKAYLTLQEFFEKLRNEPVRWGKPFAALLGALDAQLELGAAAIGGKDSMSGTFLDHDVPPTLISFAIAPVCAGELVTTDFKSAGHGVYLFYGGTAEQKTAAWERFTALARAGKAASAWAVENGLAEAVMKMSLGNEVGFAAASTALDWYRPMPGAIVAELTEEIPDAVCIGITTAEKTITIGNDEASISELLALNDSVLESVYPTKTQDAGTVESFTYETEKRVAPAVKTARPKALIPVFPGTNCEYDTHRALLEAGADAEQFIIRNLTSADVADSVERFAKAVKDSQIIVIPGGFSGGDEPDGSAKLITAFFRNAAVKEQVTDLLEKRDGLMLGVCNGFQALIKLGLVPYGKIMDTDADFPTLTYNVIGRHQSRLVRTRVCSNKSPWLAGTKVGDIYTVPISHGEGRFLASEELVKKLAENGQIATQYVDLDGYATIDAAFNPNGSICAIEGITSPDGRVFGKMGHTERIGKELYRNVPGQYEMELFTSAVRYFK